MKLDILRNCSKGLSTQKVRRVYFELLMWFEQNSTCNRRVGHFTTGATTNDFHLVQLFHNLIRPGSLAVECHLIPQAIPSHQELTIWQNFLKICLTWSGIFLPDFLSHIVDQLHLSECYPRNLFSNPREDLLLEKRDFQPLQPICAHKSETGSHSLSKHKIHRRLSSTKRSNVVWITHWSTKLWRTPSICPVHVCQVFEHKWNDAASLSLPLCKCGLSDNHRDLIYTNSFT